MTEEAKTLHGNAAALYEALVAVSDLADEIVSDPVCAVAVANSAKILEIASEALSKPLRNCDVGTPADHRQRFKEFCEEHFIGCTCEKCPLKDVSEGCAFYWEQMQCC